MWQRHFTGVPSAKVNESVTLPPHFVSNLPDETPTLKAEKYDWLCSLP